MTRRTGSAVLSFVLVWLCCSLVSAEAEQAPDIVAEASTKSAASEHFRLGVELFREGAFAAALSELKRAYELVPDYRVHYNIAQTELSLSDFVAASKSFQRYLDEGGLLVEPRRRREIETQLVELSRRTAKLVIHVSQADAEIALDGVVIGKAPLADEWPVSIGRHTVSARAAGGASAELKVDVAGGDRRTLKLVLSVPVANAERVSRPEPVRLPVRLGRRTRWGMGLLGGGVALGLGAGTAWLFSRKAHDAYERDRDEGKKERAHTAKRRSDGLLLSAEVGGATGALLTATSIVLFLTVLSELTSPADGDSASPSEARARASTRVHVGLGSVGLSRRF